MLFLAAAEPTQTVEKLGPVEVGATFPIFGGYTAAGNYYSFRRNIGKQDLMVVSYFATWCKPCKKHLPVMEAFINAHPNVNGVYIALEKKATPVQRFAEQLKLKTPIVMDKFETIAKRHGVIIEGQNPSIPKTFLINKEGHVQSIIVLEGEDFETILRNALK